MPYERSKRALSSSSSLTAAAAAPAGTGASPSSSSSSKDSPVRAGTSPIILKDAAAAGHRAHISDSAAVCLDMVDHEIGEGAGQLASPAVVCQVFPSRALLLKAGPVLAGQAICSTPKILALVFALPLLLQDGGPFPAGLVHGALAAKDPMAIAYLAYISLLLVLPALAGAATDALNPRRRRLLLLVLLAGVCLVGPLALVVLLHMQSPYWTAVVGTVTAGVVLAELVVPSLLVELVSLTPPGSSPLELSMLANTASLVGLALTTLLVGVPALIAVHGHQAALPAAQYASIAGLALCVICLVYAAVGGQRDPGREQRQQQQQRQDGKARSAAAAAPLQRDPTAILRVMATSPPAFRRFLFLRCLYQAGARSAGYLAVIYAMRQLNVHSRIASTALVLALVAAVVGGGLSQGFLSAHETGRRRQRQQAGHTRAGQASSALPMTVGSGAGTTAGRVISQQPQQQSRNPVAAASPVDTLALGQAPLLMWLVVLAVVFAGLPTEMKLDTHTGDPELTPSRELGVVYILSLLVGLGLGFVRGYEHGVLADFLWPPHPAGVGQGQLHGSLLTLAALLEWAPTLLYAGMSEHHIEAQIRALVPCFALPPIMALLFLLGDRVGVCGDGVICWPRLCWWSGGGADNGDEPPERARPRLGGRGRSSHMSLFLLRALPSHLSTILESESSAVSHVAAVSPPAAAASSSPVGDKAGAPRSPPLDWTTRT